MNPRPCRSQQPAAADSFRRRRSLPFRRRCRRPERRPPGFTLLVALLLTTPWPAVADIVTLAGGDQLPGSVFSLAPDGIEIETEDGVRRLGVGEYRDVAFAGEPAEFGAARRSLAAGKPQEARETLASVPAEDLADQDRRIREEHDYLLRLSAALAAGPGESAAAADALADFLERNSRTHHAYAGREALGDLFARAGRVDEAAAAYRELERGPPAVRVRAAAALGRLLAQTGRPAEAIGRFQAAAAIETDPADAASVVQKREAALGLARCLAAVGRAAEGVAAVEQLIRDAEPDDGDLLARAYAALGACQRSGGSDADALISFLTVDLVHNRVAEVRAEALGNLVELWEATGNPERARAAKAALIDGFPDSSWARKLAKPDG